MMRHIQNNHSVQRLQAYYHNTKKHSATADGGFFGGGVITQIANKDYWAVACSMNGLFGRKTYYNVYN